jgi:hypothetical protein
MAMTSFHTRLRILLAMLFLLLAWPPAQAADAGWRLVKDKNGIKVYMRHTDESKIKTFRGVMAFDVENPSSLIALFNDYAAMPRWAHFISSAEELGRKSPLDRSLRFTTALPWPVSDREALVHAVVRQDPLTYDVDITLSNAPHLLPPNPDMVRFPWFRGRFDFDVLSANRVEATYEVEIDPGGYIPAWMANILAQDAPYFTLDKLRRIHQRAEYQGKTFDYLDFPAPGSKWQRPAAR